MTAAPLPDKVAAVIDNWPAPAQARFHHCRSIIQRVAAADPAIGPLTETLKWGEPSFLTEMTGAGSTLRMAWKSTAPGELGLFVICRTDSLADLRDLYPDTFRYEGTRAAFLPLNVAVNDDAVAFLARIVLTYHLR